MKLRPLCAAVVQNACITIQAGETSFIIPVFFSPTRINYHTTVYVICFSLVFFLIIFQEMYFFVTTKVEKR